MKHCAICDKPLPPGRSRYCGRRCYFASKRDFNRRRYADPAQAAAMKAAVKAWREANRDYHNAMRREWYARRKAARFAAVLAKAQP